MSLGRFWVPFLYSTCSMSLQFRPCFLDFSSYCMQEKKKKKKKNIVTVHDMTQLVSWKKIGGKTWKGGRRGAEK
ncbi:hypothetical protein M432DRAFT_473313 [Thermoascus aurantiacus ATCC 26904]